MLDAADAIEQFMDGVQKDDFAKDELRQSAVIQKLSVIGVAAVQLSRSFWKQHPEINWRSIAKFRFIGLHKYFSSVDSSILWATVSKRIPALRKKVAQILGDTTNRS